MAAPIDLHEVADREHEARSRYPWRIKACSSTACQSAGSAATFAAFEESIETSDLALDAAVTPTGCMGLCSQGPLVRVLRRGGDETMYQNVDVTVAGEIVRSHIRNHEPVEANVLDTGIPFFAAQERIVLANGGIIDPDRIEGYVAHGGYLALENAITKMTPEEVVETVRESGLRGRGGADPIRGRFRRPPRVSSW